MITLLREQGIGISVGLLLAHQIYPEDWRLSQVGMLVLIASFILWMLYSREERNTDSPMRELGLLSCGIVLLLVLGVYVACDQGLIYMVRLWRSY